MLLSELIGVKKYANHTPDELAKELDNASPYKLAGVGAMATVFEKGDVIYKFWFEDKAYESFISYVQKHQSNPALPKLLSKVHTLPVFFKRTPSMPERFSWIKMEKLKPYHSKFLQGSKEGDGEDGPLHTYSLNGLIIDLDAYFNSHDHRGEPSTVESFIKDKFIPKLGVRPNEVCLNLIQTIYDIWELRPAGGNLDLQVPLMNVMMRGDQPVIIDPLADRKSLSLNLKLMRELESLQQAKASK